MKYILEGAEKPELVPEEGCPSSSSSLATPEHEEKMLVDDQEEEEEARNKNNDKDNVERAQLDLVINPCQDEKNNDIDGENLVKDESEK